MNAIDKSFWTGIEFAKIINETPQEQGNWRELGPYDDLPDGGYIALKREFGEVTAEMERAYKKGFNSIVNIPESEE